MNRNLHILFLLLLSITIYAQRAPITVTTILTPPYTTSLSTMAESGSTRLMVNLLVNDVTITEIPVKLHIKMESAGITVESIPTQAVRPMFLGGGEARVLTGDDFAEYLRLDNLNFKGLSKDAYVKSGQLPAGLWKFSITVRHFHTNKIISNVGTATAWITSYQPPVLTSPKDGDIAPSNAALPLTFSWQASKHMGGTAAIMYRFEMWERRIDGVPAQAVAASVPPIYTTETAGLTATVLPATLALEPGMKYCWRVTAYDPSGMVTIENNGESEVRTFQYLEKCPEVCGLTVDIKDDTGYASWEENRQHLGGYNFEFYDDEGTCHKTLWGSSNKTAGIGGEYGKTWHVRVQGVCRSGIEGPWSDWVDFKIPDAFKPLKDENGKTYECGMEIPARVITNFELIDNIQKGDTLEDERGTTKYIIHSATKNEDGSFRGLSYMKLSFWGVKVLGEYNNMRVNTDGVIIGRYAWKSVKSDLLVADPEAIEKWADELALEMAGATYNNTIKDTIVLEYSKGYVRFETIRRDGDKYFAVTSDNKDVEITSMINGKTRALVQDGDGHELVIDKDGNVMGVEEYKKCGGSSKLLSEHNAYRDSTMATTGNVKFSKIKDETYGFDEWRGADYDKDVYDNFNGYRPTYIGAQKSSSIKVAASQTKGVRFITERGVPILANTADNTLNLAIGTAGKQTVYAYRDSTLVGKLCIQAYDVKEVKVHVVRVNNAKMPSADKLQSELNEIFSQAVVKLTLDELEPITIKLDHKFKHGGTRRLRAYNTDQRLVIDELQKRSEYNSDDFYLFFVDDIERLDDEGNPTSDIIGGYMPVGWHFGFIYNNPKIAYVAHELGHGTLALHHTFSDETETFSAPKESTDNLMDYKGGSLLNHKQWQWAHENHGREWFEEEDDGELVVQLVQCLTAAAIDVAANYVFKWVELWYDGTPVNITDYNAIFGAMNTAEVITSAGIACATSVLPIPTNKAKLISALAGGFGAGAAALAEDLQNQYNDIQSRYPNKNVGDILSLVDWGRSLKSAGVQALVGGVISGVSTYAATHPKFVNFTEKLNQIGYIKLQNLLQQAGLDNSIIVSFCKCLHIRRAFNYQGVAIKANPQKTTTILGRWSNDMKTIKSAMTEYDFNVGNSVYGKTKENVGGFNFLDIPGDPDMNTFWEKYNKPFLDMAIERGDDIALSTIPKSKTQVINNGQLLGMYAKELKYLSEIEGFKPSNVSDEVWNTIKSWFK